MNKKSEKRKAAPMSLDGEMLFRKETKYTREFFMHIKTMYGTYTKAFRLRKDGCLAEVNPKRQEIKIGAVLEVDITLHPSGVSVALDGYPQMLLTNFISSKIYTAMALDALESGVLNKEWVPWSSLYAGNYGYDGIRSLIDNTSNKKIIHQLRISSGRDNLFVSAVVYSIKDPLGGEYFAYLANASNGATCRLYSASGCPSWILEGCQSATEKNAVCLSLIDAGSLSNPSLSREIYNLSMESLAKINDKDIVDAAQKFSRSSLVSTIAERNLLVSGRNSKCAADNKDTFGL